MDYQKHIPLCELDLPVFPAYLNGRVQLEQEQFPVVFTGPLCEGQYFMDWSNTFRTETIYYVDSFLFEDGDIAIHILGDGFSSVTMSPELFGQYFRQVQEKRHEE